MRTLILRRARTDSVCEIVTATYCTANKEMSVSEALIKQPAPKLIMSEIDKFPSLGRVQNRSQP